MKPVMTTKKRTGESSGRVTWRKVDQRPAPSILAASYSSGGTPCSPARKIGIDAPTPQRCMKTRTGFDWVGLSSQSCRGTPIWPSAQLAKPNSGWKISIHSSAVATIGVTEGRK